MPRPGLLSLLVALCCAALTPAAASAAPPTFGHVFVIVLENKNYDDTFGPDPGSPYLARTLTAQGQLLTQYHGIGHLSLDNYIAMVSGQSPNPITQSDCQIFQDLLALGTGADGQTIGLGCVYPASVQTVAGQLEERGLTWRGYMEDMATPCQHPEINGQDHTQSATAQSQYAARHNPFVYFHSIIDTPSCAANDVPLDRLTADLASEATTANFSFITPDLCHDAHDEHCPDGGKGGMAAADEFLRTWVPRIQASPAFKRDGLLVVTFDESESGAESCCVDDAPNTPNPGAILGIGQGGGRIGAVLLSPFVAPGTRNDHPYNHYSLLRSVEDAFGLLPLGLAGRSTPFGDDVFNGPRCFNRPLPQTRRRDLPRGTLIGSAEIGRARGRLRLTVAMNHSADLVLKAADRRGRERRVGPRRGRACRTYRVTLPRGTRSASVKASVRGHRETRAIRAPHGRAVVIEHS
jgi:hypothetical protein